MSHSELHMFTNECDVVIAHDMRDARAVWCHATGGTRADFFAAEWTEMPDDEPIGAICDEQGRISDSGEVLTLPAAEWAKRNGRGFLCSTEY